MSETKLPKEVIEQIDALCEPVFAGGYASFKKDLMQQGATITAAHYETENKRLVELLREQWCVNKSYELSGFDELNEDWQQYCKENVIKE